VDDAPSRGQRRRLDADRRGDREQVVARQVRLEEEVGGRGVDRQTSVESVAGGFVQGRTDGRELDLFGVEADRAEGSRPGPSMVLGDP